MKLLNFIFLEEKIENICIKRIISRLKTWMIDMERMILWKKPKNLLRIKKNGIYKHGLLLYCFWAGL